MSLFLNHPEFFNRPILLSDGEKADPRRVLEGFTEDYNLCEIREIIENIIAVCLTSDSPPFDKGTERANLRLFCKNTLRVFEAALWMIKPDQPKAPSTS